MPEWVRNYESLFWWLTSFSAASLIVSAALLPWLATRIPCDYFAGRRRPDPTRVRDRSFVRLLIVIGKNMLGLLCVAAGVAMLVLPGQGVLTILLGLALMNFPGKYRIERRLATWGPVFTLLNRLRRKRGCPELMLQRKSEVEAVLRESRNAQPSETVGFVGKEPDADSGQNGGA